MVYGFDLRIRRFSIALTAALLILPGLIHGQEAPRQSSEYTIAGTIRDSLGSPVSGVSVGIEKANLSNPSQTATNDSGEFFLSAPSEGTFTLRMGKPGFRETVESVTFPRNDRAPLNVVLVQSESQSAGDKLSKAAEFSDSPNFTIAGVKDWSAAGTHGSDVNLRTSEALARETHGLGSESSRQTPPSAVPIESETSLRAGLARFPESFEANRHLGEFYLRSQRYDQAVPLLEAASRIQPQDIPNGFDLALAYKNNGALAQARDQIKKMLADTDRADLHRLLGDVDEQMNDSLAAVQEYQRATQLEPSEQNYFAWASELLLHRAIQPAVDVFTKGVHAYPGSERMLAGLGAALYASGLYAQAAERFCAASDLKPADPTPYIFLGKVALASSQSLPCSVEKLARFSRGQPENALSNYYYAVALWKKTGDSDRATAAEPVETLLKKCIAIDPKFAEAYLQLGIVYADRGELRESVAAYQNAIGANPNLPEAHFRLAQAYKKTGESLKASREFEAYQRIQKNETLATEQQRREIQQFVVVLKDQPQSSPTHEP